MFFLDIFPCMNFFSDIFPCMNFFGFFPHPPPPRPHHFSNGPSLKRGWNAGKGKERREAPTFSLFHIVSRAPVFSSVVHCCLLIGASAEERGLEAIFWLVTQFSVRNILILYSFYAFCVRPYLKLEPPWLQEKRS